MQSFRFTCWMYAYSKISYKNISSTIFFKNVDMPSGIALAIKHNLPRRVPMVPYRNPGVLLNIFPAIPLGRIGLPTDRACYNTYRLVSIILLSVWPNDVVFVHNQPVLAIAS